MFNKELIESIAKDCHLPTGDPFLDKLHADYNEGSPREDWPHYYRFLYKFAPYLERYMELGFHYGSALHHVARGNPKCNVIGLDCDPEKYNRAKGGMGHFGIHCVSSVNHAMPDDFQGNGEFNHSFADYLCGDNYFDALLIDTDHTYATTAEEFRLWSPKVKPGGIILFDDIDAPEYADGCGKFFRELDGEKLSLPQLHPDNWGFGVWMKPK